MSESSPIVASQLANLRDVGGLAVSPQGTTRSGVLYRADAPYPGDAPPPVRPWPPALIVDLRSPQERRGAHPLAGPGTNVLELPLAAEAGIAGMDPEADADGLTLLGLYEATVTHGADRLACIADAVATAPGPVLLHCAAGKDRTGVAVAVLLAAVGVPDDVIVADYVATTANMPRVLERMGAAAGGRDEAEALIRVATARPDLVDTSVAAIGAVLAVVGAVPGGAAAWLTRAGVAEDRVRLLRERLVDGA